MQRSINATTLVVVFAFGILALPGAAAAQESNRNPTAPGKATARCAGGTFWLHDRLPLGLQWAARDGGDDIGGREPDQQGNMVVIDGSQISIGNVCPPVTAKLKQSQDGTQVSAHWRDCSGIARNVRFDGMIDASTCSVLTGVLKGQGVLEANTNFKTPTIGTTVLGDALRIGTYNAQFLPGGFGNDGSPCGFSGDDDVVRPEKIAERIKASKYDIIALNEVFDEDSRQVFVDKLKGVYPHHVDYLTGGTVANEDSGLMLFSRYPFISLSDTSFQISSGDCEGSDCSKVGFYEYGFSDGDDAMSEKGVGLVRIQNPQTQRIYDVLFTHLQASYPGDDNEDDAEQHFHTRGLQLNNYIATLYGTTLTDQQKQTDDVFLIGDLNIDGDFADADKGLDDLDKQNLYEWIVRFGTAGEFFHDTLLDAWAFETSPDDRGLTSLRHWGSETEDASARLDYLLRNHPSSGAGVGIPGLCTEHLTLSHNLRFGNPTVESGLGEPGTEAGVCELSDHIGLTADLNLWAPQCSPVEASVVSIQPGETKVLGGNIPYPASMQWFRFDEPGTYSFAVDGADGANFHVYESTDLSTPMTQYKAKTTDIDHFTAKKYELSKAPFYVRVFNPDRTKSGPYTLYAKRAGCTGPDDTCILPVNQPLDQKFPLLQVVNADDTMWFELDTEAADSGAAQDLRFVIDQYAQSVYPPDILSLELRANDATTTLDSDTQAEPDPNDGDPLQLEITRQEAQATTLYLLLKRKDANGPELSYRVGWVTNLTVLFGAQQGESGAGPYDLTCFDPTDDFAEGSADEPYLSVEVDGTTVIDSVYLQQLDEGEHRNLEDIIPTIRYLKQIVVKVVDTDGGNDDDVLTTTIGPLGETLERCQFKENALLAPDTGVYRFYFNRCHGLNKP